LANKVPCSAKTYGKYFRCFPLAYSTSLITYFNHTIFFDPLNRCLSGFVDGISKEKSRHIQKKWGLFALKTGGGIRG